MRLGNGPLTSNTQASNDFDPYYHNLTTDENNCINLNQTTESGLRQKDFRISTSSNQASKNIRKPQQQLAPSLKENSINIDHSRAGAKNNGRRQLTMLEEQKKQALERKLQQERIKSKIKKDYHLQTVEIGGGDVNSQAYKESIIS